MMRAPLLVLMASICAAPAAEAAPGWQPVRIHLECQGWGRTKACPAFLLGFIDETPLLQRAPRGQAEVELFYNVTFRASDDLVNLRFTSHLPGAPRALDVTQEIDSRASDDAQRAQLRPAFLRGLAPFIGAVHPEAVEVVLVAPPDGERRAPATTAWSFGIYTGGFGSWTRNYRSANGWGGVGVNRVDADTSFGLGVDGSYSITRQPSLVIDGQPVSLDTDSYGISSAARASRNLGPHWAAGVRLRAGHEDPLGRFRHTLRAHAGVSYDWFPADDPRGNRLEVADLAGAQADRYNVRNVLGEKIARFPSHVLLAAGSVRRDRVTFSISASAAADMIHPRTRYLVEVSPSVEVQIGAHVDVSMSLGITKQAVPGPADIDQGDFGEVTRASYAEPLRVFSSFNLSLHWDRSNPDRNNRFDIAGELGPLDPL